MRKKLTLLFALLCVSMMGFAIDWSSKPWIGNGSGNAAYTDAMKIDLPAGVDVVNIQVPGFSSGNAGIYITVPDAAFNKATFNGEERTIYTQGAGMILPLASFTDMYTEVVILNDETVRWTVTVYWKDGTDTGGGSSLADPELSINSSAETLDASTSETFQIVANQSGDGAISYESSNAGIASVDNTGLVTAVGRGVATITVRTAETATYEASSKTLTVTVTGPINWDAIGWLGNSNNKYKMVVEPAGAGVNIDVVQVRAEKQGIYVTFPSAVWGDCSLSSTDYDTQGAGRWYFLSAFPLLYNEFTQVCDGKTYTFYVYYADGATGGAANPHLTLTNPTKSSILLPKGENITVTYTSENEAAASIESSATGVASVNGNEVTAEAEGTATITVSQAEVADIWQAASKTFEVNAFDWENIGFIGNNSDYKFKASSNSVNLDNNAIIPWHENNCIHLILPDAVDLGCSLAGYYETEGAGMFINVEAFTTRQTPFTVSCHGIVYDCYVYYNLDETAPVISDVQVTSHNYEQAIISITANEAFVSAEVFNNGVSMGSFTPSAGAITVTGLTAATTYDQLTVKVTDAAGNVSEAANVPEFTTSDAPTITAATYNGYSTDGNFFVKYAITRNPSKQLEVSAEIEWLPSFGGVNPQIWKGGDHINLTKSGSVYTGVFTNEFEDATNIDFYFRFEYANGATALDAFSYTVGSEQAAPASIPAGAVVLNKTSNSLSVGETDVLAATVYPSFATNKTIEWTSDNTDAATVDNGTVTAVADGTAHITATCGEVNAQYTVSVAASLEETKYYGTGAFTNFADSKDAFAYEYCFTRATNHEVTLDVVFSEDMTPYIGENDFKLYVGGQSNKMDYDAATKTATYHFGSQSEGAAISYYFYFIMAGGAHQSAQVSYTVGSANEKVYACVVDEDINNSAVLAAYDGRTAQVIIDRSFTADNLYTLVLPFNADAAQTAEKLPGKLTKLNNTIVKENEDLRLNFVDAVSIEAGVPYLYSPSEDVVNPVFTGVTISSALRPTAPTGEKAAYYGIYAPTTGEELKNTPNAYVLGSDQYLYAASVLQNDQPMKALRGYFVLSFPSGANAPRARVIFNSQETEIATGISDVQSDNIQCTKVLRDGQLLIIRDGRTYNAQGQLIK